VATSRQTESDNKNVENVKEKKQIWGFVVFSRTGEPKAKQARNVSVKHENRKRTRRNGVLTRR